MMSMSWVYRGLLIVAIAAVMIWLWSWALPQLAGGDAEDPETTASARAADTWTVTHVYDGDSFVAERDGVTEDVRVIGIDTPERGECGADEAREAAQVTLLDQEVALVPGAQTDRDVHDRLLRYVEIAGEDYGYSMIEYGFAIARYDSRTDQPHDREAQYRDLDDQVDHMCADFDGAAG